MRDILNNKYVLDNLIGKGAYGLVYKAHDIKDENKKYAIKRIDKKYLADDYLMNAYKEEMKIMRLMSHENSVNLFDDFKEDSNYNLVMELCDSDLDIELNKHFSEYGKGFSELEVWMIMNQFNKIFLKMTENNVIHRDLKLKNLMIKRDEKIEIIGFILKLGDFGFSKELSDAEDLTSTLLGTPATQAPEVRFTGLYNSKVDLWSIGVIMYQLLFKSLPFKSKTKGDLTREILNWKGVQFPQNNELSEICKDLINKLLKKEPKERIDFKEYFSHKFFLEEHKKELLEEQKRKKEKVEFKEIIDFDKKFNKLILIKEFNGYKLYKGKDLLNNKYVYIKELSRSLIDNNEQNKKIFETEIELLSKLRGNKFPLFFGLAKTDTLYYIIIEYFSGKILSDFSSKKIVLDESFKNYIYAQLSPAISEIKEKNLDLSENNFAFSFYENKNNFDVKFFDYGLISIFSEKKEKINFFKLENFLKFDSEENKPNVDFERKEPTVKDEDIENILEIVQNKINCIYEYFNIFLEEIKNDICMYNDTYKEITTFLYFCYLECRTIINFLKINGDYDVDKIDKTNQEIHIINFDKNNENNKYNYSKINFIDESKENNKYLYNRENPTFEYYLKIFIDLKNKLNDLYIKLEEYNKDVLINEKNDIDKKDELILITNSEINRMEVNCLNDKLTLSNHFVKKCLKEGNLDKLFKKIFENIIVNYYKGKKDKIKNELNFSKYLFEYIILLKAILGNVTGEKNFFEIINNIKGKEGVSFVSFIGGKIKSMKYEGIFEYNININNYYNYSCIQIKEGNNNIIEQFILFYKKIGNILIQ